MEEFVSDSPPPFVTSIIHIVPAKPPCMGCGKPVHRNRIIEDGHTYHKSCHAKAFPVAKPPKAPKAPKALMVLCSLCGAQTERSAFPAHVRQHEIEEDGETESSL